MEPKNESIPEGVETPVAATPAHALRQSPGTPKREESEIFRKKYRELSGDERDLVAEIKEVAGELAHLLGRVKGREGALSLTKLEESVMWGVKGITG